MRIGDWIVVPNTQRDDSHSELTSDYVFDEKAKESPYHFSNINVG